MDGKFKREGWSQVWWYMNSILVLRRLGQEFKASRDYRVKACQERTE